MLVKSIQGFINRGWLKGKNKVFIPLSPAGTFRRELGISVALSDPRVKEWIIKPHGMDIFFN